MTAKTIVILGPTASGKSSLAIHLAKKFNGEIISADSRQVYKGMDLGTGKISKREQKLVPHHLIDVASPKNQFTVSHFQKLAKKNLTLIQRSNKVAFIVGGTAFYIYSLIDNLKLPEVKPNLKLRTALGKKSVKELFVILKAVDSKRAKTIDKNNPIRLIRAIEINIVTGKPVPIHGRPELVSGSRKKIPDQVRNDILILGINKRPDELRKLINKRVDQRLKLGLVNEVRRLLKAEVSLKKLHQIGLTYKIATEFVLGRISKAQMSDQIKTAEYQYSRRQMTWFKRDKRIRWVKNKKQAERLVKRFINH